MRRTLRPVTRRTCPTDPVEEPTKNSPTHTTILALILVGVIIHGHNKLRPEFQATRELNNRSRQESQVPDPSTPKSAPSDSDPAANPAPASTDQPNSSAVVPAPVSTAASAPAKSDPVPTPVSVVEKKSSTSAAAAYKTQIEATLTQRSLSGRVRISATNNTTTITGN